MKRAGDYLIPFALLIVALAAAAVSVVAPDLATLLRFVAIALGFFGLRQLEAALRKPDAHMLQLAMVALTWLLVIKLLLSAQMPNGATYLLVVASAAGTAAFFQKQMLRHTKKLIYGLFTFLVVFPAILSLLNADAFNRLFGESAGDAIVVGAVAASGAYAVAWKLAWSPGRFPRPPVDS